MLLLALMFFGCPLYWLAGWMEQDYIKHHGDRHPLLNKDNAILTIIVSITFIIIIVVKKDLFNY